MTKTNDATGWYANVFKGWPTKLVGVQPTAAQLDTIHKLGARPGKQALANAMALRDSGVTGAQIIMACGAPQLNKMRGFVTDGLLRFIATPAGDNGHKVYKLAVTAKGQARIDRATKAAADQAANADGTGKPKAPKAPRKPKAVKPAATPAADVQPQAPAGDGQPQASV